MERSQIKIDSTDFWIKVIAMLQQNWGLINPAPKGSGVIIFFITDNPAIFDQLEFDSYPEATRALKHNGVWKYRRDLKAQEFISTPKPPFYENKYRKNLIYSSGKYWS
jgi:hypothetical protein